MPCGFSQALNICRKALFLRFGAILSATAPDLASVIANTITQ
jgi:hypothetical protein